MLSLSEHFLVSKSSVKWDFLQNRVWKWNIHFQIHGCLLMWQQTERHPNNRRNGKSLTVTVIECSNWCFSVKILFP
ncbi:hypothetical protein CRYUN_Cryun36dG0009000 [Craigia yunnanensis]